VLNWLSTSRWRPMGYSSIILDLSTRWRWVVSFTPRPLYSRGISLLYRLGRRLSGPQNHSGVKKNVLPLPGIEHRPVATPTELSIVHKCLWWTFNHTVPGRLTLEELYSAGKLRIGEPQIVCYIWLLLSPWGELQLVMGGVRTSGSDPCRLLKSDIREKHNRRLGATLSVRL
jgi:hypothetical protein